MSLVNSDYDFIEVLYNAGNVDFDVDRVVLSCSSAMCLSTGALGLLVLVLNCVQ